MLEEKILLGETGNIRRWCRTQEKHKGEKKGQDYRLQNLPQRLRKGRWREGMKEEKREKKQVVRVY